MFSSCNTLEVESKPIEYIGKREIDSVVIEKLVAHTSGDYRKLGAISDLVRLAKIKNCLNNAKGKSIKFIPKYNIIVFCSDTIIDLGFAKPQNIISYGSTSLINNDIESIINEMEAVRRQIEATK